MPIAAKRAALGRAFIEEISGLPAVMPPELPAADRGTFWFFYFRLRLDKLKCSRAEFVDALKAEGAAAQVNTILTNLAVSVTGASAGAVSLADAVTEIGRAHV